MDREPVGNRLVIPAKGLSWEATAGEWPAQRADPKAPGCICCAPLLNRGDGARPLLPQTLQTVLEGTLGQPVGADSTPKTVFTQSLGPASHTRRGRRRCPRSPPCQSAARVPPPLASTVPSSSWTGEGSTGFSEALRPRPGPTGSNPDTSPGPGVS